MRPIPLAGQIFRAVSKRAQVLLKGRPPQHALSLTITVPVPLWPASLANDSGALPLFYPWMVSRI